MASAAIAAGRPDRAVELLELTRGVAAEDIIVADDGSIERLHAVAPGLADEFTALRMRLASSRLAGTDAEFTGHDTPGGAAGGDDGNRLAQERRDAQAAWKEVISRIRAISGFENFLDSPPAAQLTTLAREGPVVIVTVSRSRADALILTGDSAEPVRHLPLPGITQLDADRNADRLAAMYRSYPFPRGQLSLTHGDMEAVIRGILAWLWDASQSLSCPCSVIRPLRRGQAHGHGCGGARSARWPCCRYTRQATTKTWRATMQPGVPVLGPSSTASFRRTPRPCAACRPRGQTRRTKAPTLPSSSPSPTAEVLLYQMWLKKPRAYGGSCLVPAS